MSVRLTYYGNTRLSKIEITRSFRSFLAKYRPAKGYVVHVGNSDERKAVENTDIELLSYFKLLFQEDIVKNHTACLSNIKVN